MYAIRSYYAAVLLSRVLGEDQMLRVVLDRFSGLKDQLPGYDEAWTLLTSNASYNFV